MADAVAARREARRKRILENSQNRLHLISGKLSSESFKESPITKSTSETKETLFVFGNDPLSKNSDQNGDIFNVTEEQTQELYDIASILTSAPPVSMLPPATIVPPATIIPPAIAVLPSTYEKLVINKYDVVLISLLVQFLHSVSIMTSNDSYILLPLLIYTLTKIVLLPPKQNLNFTSAVLLLNGISPPKVQKISFILQLLMMFGEDVCVYLFCTICLQSLFITVKNKIT